MKNKDTYIILGTAVVIVLSVGIVYYITKDSNNISASNKKVKSILFIGDSNTFANFSYADQLKKIFPDLVIKKIAQNGANTNWMKQQLEQELKKNKYDIVSILGGSNDVYGGVKLDVTKNNLDSMYKLAHDNGAKVIAVTPPNKDFYVSKTEPKQVILKDLVSYIKSNKTKDYFIDFYSMTNDKKYFTSADGYLHPQASAHKNLEDKVSSVLKLA